MSKREVPPRWAEALLRALLHSRDRDTITGDLLEEYREGVVPSLGVFRGRLWYLRQALSFVRLAGIWQLLVRTARCCGAMEKALFPAFKWALAAGITEYAIFFQVPASVGLPTGVGLFVFTTAALGIGGATAIHSAQDVWFLLRACCWWTLLFAMLMAATLKAAVVAPGPLFAGVVGILLAAGFQGARPTGQVRMGIASAVTTSMAVSILVVAILSLRVDPPHPPLGMLLVIPAFSTIPGTVGAVFGTTCACRNRGPWA